jgi:hypothetical protein
VYSAIRVVPRRRNGEVVLTHLVPGRLVSRLFSTTDYFWVPHEWDHGLGGPELQVSLLLWSIITPRSGKAAKMLLDIGATPSLADNRGRTPLHACVFVALRCSGAPLAAQEVALSQRPSKYRDYPFPYDVIADLVQRGGSLDAEDEDGNTPLDYALELFLTVARNEERWLALPRMSLMVVHFTLGMVFRCGRSPSAAVQARLAGRFGEGVLNCKGPLTTGR